MDGQSYKIGLVITIKDRYEYTRQTFIDLMKTDFPCSVLLVLVDDGSGEETERLISNFPFPYNDKFKPVCIRNLFNMGVALSLKEGWDYCVNEGCEILCNLDNDVRLKPEWLKTLIDLHAQYPEKVITGFNANNPNHKVKYEADHFVCKSSIGGINMLFTKEVYKHIRVFLLDNSWDWEISKHFQLLRMGFIVSKPSVVQHIGKIGIHSSEADHVDIAEDF
jgi:GT2 family glycosyltransferase